MDEACSQANLTSLMERLARLEREMMELRQLLGIPMPRLQEEAEQPVACSHPMAFSTLEIPAAGYWEVSCFGRFHLRCAGRDLVPCKSRRGQSLLKYLLSSPGYTASTGRLIECFWPHMDAVAGAHNLQMAVRALRSSLQGCGPGGSDETVLFCDNHYLLHPALSIVQDVDIFRDSYRQGQEASKAGKSIEAIQAFERAHTSYRSDYLADPLEAWATSARLALQDMQLALLNALGTLSRQSGKWENAASYYHELLVIDCYREDICRHLMRCYAACGRIADVKQTYQACQEHLYRDLHLSPSTTTSRLYQHLIQPSVVPEAH